MRIVAKELSGKAAHVESFLKAFANRHRLMILCHLQNGECSVTTLQEEVGLSQSAMSQHLARLRADDLVTTRREAQNIYYSLGSKEVARLVRVLYDLFCAPEKPKKKTARKTR